MDLPRQKNKKCTSLWSYESTGEKREKNTGLDGRDNKPIQGESMEPETNSWVTHSTTAP